MVLCMGYTGTVFEGKGERWQRLPTKPPDNDEEPKHDDEEDDVPQPFAAMTFCHVVHSTEGA